MYSDIWKVTAKLIGSFTYVAHTTESGTPFTPGVLRLELAPEYEANVQPPRLTGKQLLTIELRVEPPTPPASLAEAVMLRAWYVVDQIAARASLATAGRIEVQDVSAVQYRDDASKVGRVILCGTRNRSQTPRPLDPEVFSKPWESWLERATILWADALRYDDPAKRLHALYAVLDLAAGEMNMPPVTRPCSHCGVDRTSKPGLRERAKQLLSVSGAVSPERFKEIWDARTGVVHGAGTIDERMKRTLRSIALQLQQVLGVVLAARAAWNFPDAQKSRLDVLGALVIVEFTAP